MTRSQPCMLRSSLLVSALAAWPVACGSKSEEPAPAAAAAPAPAPASVAPPAASATPDPHADPHGGRDPMAEPPMVMRTAKGEIELTIDGTPQRLDFLSFGRNAAVWIEKDGISRVTIGGSESDAGMPTFSIAVTGIKLDDVELPVTVHGGPLGKPGKAAARLTWQVGERRVYRSPEPGELEGKSNAKPTEVVLESYADGRVKGSFSGTVVMGDGKLDPPLQVRGTFDVSLRLNGVAPNPVGS